MVGGGRGGGGGVVSSVRATTVENKKLPSSRGNDIKSSKNQNLGFIIVVVIVKTKAMYNYACEYGLKHRGR